MRYFVFFILFITYSSETYGRVKLYDDLEDTIQLKNQLLAYPIIFYLPETRWGFGAAGLYNFRFRKETSTSNPSQIQLVATYTQNKQLIFVMPFELYRKNNLWKIKGELSFFRYQFNTFGVGHDTKAKDKETFKASAPRVRIDILQRYKSTYLGIRLAFEKFRIKEIKVDGILQEQSPVGLEGGINAGFGFLAHIDERDFIFNPTKGHYIELESFLSTKVLGSNYNYFRLLVNASKYLNIKDSHTIVGNIHSVFTTGNPPFFDMPHFGTQRIMRGYQDRRFTDKNMLVFQSEYRFPLYKRLQGVGFLSVGTVNDVFTSLFSHPYRLAYGAGLRFTINQKDRVRIRLDYGLTPAEGGAFYLTINDAF